MKRDTDKDFVQLKRSNDEIAKELLVRSELVTNNFELKSAYIRGALFMYTLLVFGAQATMLEELFKTTISGGAGGEVPPPST